MGLVELFTRWVDQAGYERWLVRETEREATTIGASSSTKRLMVSEAVAESRAGRV